MKWTPEAQVDLYDKVMKTRIEQLRGHDPAMADEMVSYFLKNTKEGDAAPGFREFRAVLVAIQHPETTHADKKGYTPEKTHVEDLLTQMIVNEVKRRREKEVAPQH